MGRKRFSARFRIHDSWKIVDFAPGDVVKRIVTDRQISPYAGKVTAVVPSTGKVWVQWPIGVGDEQHDPWDLMKLNPYYGQENVLTVDTGYSSYEKAYYADKLEDKSKGISGKRASRRFSQERTIEEINFELWDLDRRDLITKPERRKIEDLLDKDKIKDAEKELRKIKKKIEKEGAVDVETMGEIANAIAREMKFKKRVFVDKDIWEKYTRGLEREEKEAVGKTLLREYDIKPLVEVKANILKRYAEKIKEVMGEAVDYYNQRFDEVKTYEEIFQKHGSKFGDNLIKIALAFLYAFD